MRIVVTRTAFNERLEFDHDPDARTVAGPDAEYVQSILDTWDGRATLYGTQLALAPDPLGSSRDMAVMLASGAWELSPRLVALLPPAKPIPDDAVA